jgi:hypothetical protein
MTTAVDRETLSIYLNDHLAGLVAAIDLIDHLIADDPDPVLERELVDLQSGLQLEQRTAHRHRLRRLGDKVGQAMAWVGEKVARLKVGYGPADLPGLRRFEALETLALGFCSRRLLWHTLEHLAENGVLHSELDFGDLEQNAGHDAGNSRRFVSRPPSRP